MSNIIKGSGIIYTTGQPNTIPSVGTDAEFAIDVNGVQYAWNRDSGVWDNIGQGIEISNSNAVPSNTPTKFKPRFIVTPDRTLYFYSGSWSKVNPLPSGLFSSSAQIGRTGIYSGSGTLNGLTRVNNLGAYSFRVENIADPTDFRFILNPNKYIFLGQSSLNITFAPDPYMTIGTNEHFIVFDPNGNYSGDPELAGIKIVDQTPSEKGLEYYTNYAPTISANDRSIPDVGTIRNHLTASYANNGVKYKTLAFTLTQTDTNAPVIEHILQNDYGIDFEISSTRLAAGSYSLNFGEDIFYDPITEGITKSYILNNNNLSLNGQRNIKCYISDVNAIEIRVFGNATETADLETDNSLFIEIRTYG